MSLNDDFQKRAMEHADRVADAIHACKKAIAEMHDASSALCAAEVRAQDALTTIQCADDSADLEKLSNRISKIAFARRGMECGALTIEAERILDAAWKRLS